MEPELDQIAQAFPDYQVGSVLGRGQFGVVWGGRHRHLARPVAIKSLTRQSDGPATEHAARFRREARILAGLDHPHVVTVYDYREQGELRLLVMEHLAGGTLADRRMAGMAPEAQVASVLAAATGLHHVHQAGILHRDVKPENLMFDARGALKVTDFGVARGDVATVTTVEVTRAGQFFGTPAYVSPEQAEAAFAGSTPSIGPTADLYGLAAVYYELLTGSLTHSAEGGLIGLCHRRMSEPAAPVRALAPHVHPRIEAVVMQALARSPADRYDDLQAFALALGDAGTAAFAPGWLERSDVDLRDTGPVRRAIDAASASLPPPIVPPSTQRGAALPAPGSAPSPTVPAPDPGAPVASPPPDRRRRRAWVSGLVVLVVLALIGGALVLAGGDDDQPAAGQDDGADATLAPAPAADPSVGEMAQSWSAPTGGNIFASPLVDGDQVVVGSEDGAVYALDAGDGSEHWKVETGGEVVASAVAVGDAYVLGSNDGHVYTLARVDGATQWDVDLGFEVAASAATDGDVVVVAADKVYGLAASDGIRRWEYPAPSGSVFVSSPAIDGDVVVAASTDGTLHGIDLTTGDARWTMDRATGPVLASPRVAAGVAYVGDAGGTLWGVTAADGTVVLQQDVGSEVRSSAAVVDGTLVVGTASGQVVAATVDGEEQWVAPLPDRVDSTPAVVGDLVVVGCNDGRVYSLRLDDGTVVATYRTGGPVLSSPRPLGDGVVVGGFDDAVHALVDLAG